jgi:hypothetical protein
MLVPERQYFDESKWSDINQRHVETDAPGKIGGEAYAIVKGHGIDCSVIFARRRNRPDVEAGVVHFEGDRMIDEFRAIGAIDISGSRRREVGLWFEPVPINPITLIASTRCVEHALFG